MRSAAAAVLLNSDHNTLVAADEQAHSSDYDQYGTIALFCRIKRLVTPVGGARSAVFGHGRRKGAGKRHVERSRVRASTP